MQRDLVERARAHDHEAFAELARLSIDRLYATARLILHDPQRAEDATQEALVAAWRDISALRDPDRFDAWLRRLLVRACYREARRERARRLVEVHVQALDPSIPDGSRELADRDELERGFRALSADQRALLVLHHYLGLTVAEMADALDIPAGTVKSRLHRTTHALRARLEADARASDLVGERSV